MAFCKFCGKALQEGEVCNCQASQAANTGTPAPAPVPAPAPAPAPAQSSAPAPGTTTVTVTLPSKDAVNAAAKNIFATILNVLTHPASGGRTYVQNANKLVAIGIMGVHAIVSAIFSIILIAQLNSQLGLGLLQDSYKISGIKGFFITILFSVIFSALLTVLVLAATKILKLTASLDQVLAIASVRSIISIPLSLLACIFILINTGWGLFLFYGAILLATIFLLEAIRGLGNVPEDKIVYAVSGVVVVFVILFALLGNKLALNMYLPSELLSILDSALNF